MMSTQSSPQPPRQLRKRALLLALPLILFGLLLVLMVFGLQNNPREIPSVLVGKPAPAIALPDLNNEAIIRVNERMSGHPWLLNVWASWCAACREEHPVLLRARERYPDLHLIGLNYKDKRTDALAWLKQFRDPYQFSVTDLDGRTGIDFGVYGVPETFVIDANGKIAYKHIGPISVDDMQRKVLPLLGIKQ